MIERVPADGKASRWFYGWKGLEREGWTVSILVAPDGKTLVGLAHRGFGG